MSKEFLARRALAEASSRATVGAEEPMSGLPQDLERDIAVGLARADAEVFAAESVIAMADSRVKVIAGTLARLRALALQVGLLQPAPLVSAAPPPIDDLTRERARRLLARDGFVRGTR